MMVNLLVLLQLKTFILLITEDFCDKILKRACLVGLRERPLGRCEAHSQDPS